MGSDTAILAVEVVVGVGLMVLLAAAASRGQPREDVCDRCGAGNPQDRTHCGTCGELMGSDPDAGG
jgi:ribosomal protein L40E